jgi:hypothetical protein
VPVPRSIISVPHSDIDLRLEGGTWPDDLAGEIWISAPSASDDLSYALFGFGVMIRLSLDPGAHGAPADRWPWRVRTIDTPTKRLFDAAPEVWTSGVLGYVSPFGAPNMVNTAPLPWGDRLFATWDVGRPTEIDPSTMDFLGEVGSTASWGGPSIPSGAPLPFLFSSAHPVVDPDRDCLWTVKLTPVGIDPMQMQPSVVRYGGDGREVQMWPVASAGLNGSMHTISQTRDWLILADSGNFKADPAEMFGGERSVLIDEEVPVFFVRKDALESTPAGTEVPMHRFTLSPTTGHFYAQYDDRDGIRVLFEHMDLLDLGYRVRPDDVDAFGKPIDPAYAGTYNMAMAPSSVSEVRFDVDAGTSRREVLVNEEWCWNQQLSAMDWSTEGISQPALHHVVYQGFRPRNITQRALRAYGDRVDRSTFPGDETPACLASFRRGSLEVAARHEFPSLGDMPTSPTFVPRGPGADATKSRYAGTDPGGHDGYVVCPVLSDDGMRIEVFDASRVDAGPIATLKGERKEQVPLLLHSAWSPRAVHAPDAERLSFADELDDDHLSALPDDRLRDIARAVASDLAEAAAGPAPSRR